MGRKKTEYMSAYLVSNQLESAQQIYLYYVARSGASDVHVQVEPSFYL